MKVKIFLVTLLFSSHFLGKSQFRNKPIGHGGYFSEIGIYKKDLYFGYEIWKKEGSSIQLAKFDGKKMSFFDNPDTGEGFTQRKQYAIFKSKLILEYFDKDSSCKLAVFDGKRISLITPPSDIASITVSQSLITNNKIYFTGFTKGNQFQLLAFDGNNLEKVQTDEVPNLWGSLDYHFTYKGKTYVVYEDGSLNLKSKYALLQGNKLIYKEFYPSGDVAPILYKGEMYFMKEVDKIIKQKNSYPSLAKFDGKKTTLIENLNDSSGLILDQNEFKIKDGALNFLYNIGENKKVFAKYDGKKISLIEGQLPKKGYSDIPFMNSRGKFYQYHVFYDSINHWSSVELLEFDGNKSYLIEKLDKLGQIAIENWVKYKHKVYFKYFHYEEKKDNLAYFENRKIHVIDNPDDNEYNGKEYNPIVYKGNLVFIYNEIQLASFDGKKISLIDFER